MSTVLYPKNSEARLNEALFLHPSSEYRGAPFWSWNCTLDREQLMRQIGELQAMGFGGFHIHARTGLNTPYLGPEFMNHVVACVEEARRRGMKTWLYDEDRWPSGYGGGLVTDNTDYRARYLLFTPKSYAEQGAMSGINASQSLGVRTGKGRLLARYGIALENGRLSRYRLLGKDETAQEDEKIWYAYLEIAQPTEWFNGQTYLDTLNPRAVERFIEVTHETYRQAVGKDFGTLIPAIFTDEPQLGIKPVFGRGDEERDLAWPFTDDLPESYRTAWGEDLMASLPELFWERADGKASLTRYRYFDHVSERFAKAYADTLGAWCRQHGIKLTGHMMMEGELYNQTQAIGDCMRQLRSFDLPGMDLLCDWREYNTAKQAQSIAHQYKREGVLSELYGVTGWDFDFVGHKAQGDWQAALGVTVRVPHLTWVSMGGEAKRDYPASIGPQSPWFREYPLIENHFARVATVLTRGQPLVRVAVIHPIESFWLCFGPREHTTLEREERETAYSQLSEWLLFGLVDFDFISESLFAEQSPALTISPQLPCGAMRYDVVLVPGLRTIRSSTLERLEALVASGGRVVFLGEIPSLVDAVASERPAALAARASSVPFTRRAVLQAVEPFQLLRATLPNGTPLDTLLHQFRQDGNERHLFLCNTDRSKSRIGVRIQLSGTWDGLERDTFTGEIRALRVQHSSGETEFTHDFSAHGHLLLTLKPAVEVFSKIAEPVGVPAWVEWQRWPGRVDVELSEPNVLLLDQAEWRWNDEAWQGTQEMLRIDNALRSRLKLPARHGHVSQTWTDRAPAPVLGMIELRCSVQVDHAFSDGQLAGEFPAGTTLMLDGEPLPLDGKTWWVDEAIRCHPLPPLAVGQHQLVLRVPYTRLTSLEWFYLLGDFGISTQGNQSRLTAPVRALNFGDWTAQGLPFYAGNVTYRWPMPDGLAPEGGLRLCVPRFKAPLLSLSVGEGTAAPIAFAPFQHPFTEQPRAREMLRLTAFGNRANSFGCLHNVNPNLTWLGPDAWRSKGVNWDYGYQLKPMGILSAPIFETFSSTP